MGVVDQSLVHRPWPTANGVAVHNKLTSGLLDDRWRTLCVRASRSTGEGGIAALEQRKELYRGSRLALGKPFLPEVGQPLVRRDVVLRPRLGVLVLIVEERDEELGEVCPLKLLGCAQGLTQRQLRVLCRGGKHPSIIHPSSLCGSVYVGGSAYRLVPRRRVAMDETDDPQEAVVEVDDEAEDYARLALPADFLEILDMLGL